jgi:hypothetical protein
MEIKAGASIVIVGDHPDNGKVYKIGEVREDGWVLTTDNHLFHREFFEVHPSPELKPQRGSKRKKPDEKLAVTPSIAESASLATAELPASPVEVVSDELTPDEESDRLFLERKVERAFYEAGRALRELRDRRLYRSTHKTFEEYVRERFGMKQSRSYQLIDAAKVVDNLLSEVPPLVEVSGSGEKVPPLVEAADNEAGKVPPLVEVTGSDEKVPPLVEVSENPVEKVPPLVEVLPTSERQCRVLAKLEPQQQREVWCEAVTESGGKVPSARVVSDIVQRIRERSRVPISYRVGDVVEIIVKENPELRGLGGCWAIVSEVREFSVLVRAWNGEYTVREENLKDLGYSPDQREEVKKLSGRLRRAFGDRLTRLSLIEEETVKAIGLALGKLKRPCLTPLEEKLLALLELEFDERQHQSVSHNDEAP